MSKMKRAGEIFCRITTVFKVLGKNSGNDATTVFRPKDSHNHTRAQNGKVMQKDKSTEAGNRTRAMKPYRGNLISD